MEKAGEHRNLRGVDPWRFEPTATQDRTVYSRVRSVCAAQYAKWAGGLFLTALLMSRPQAAAYGATQAMKRWYTTVAPSLLPFLALMPLLTGTAAADVYERLLGRVIGAMFGLPGAAAPAVMIGMVAGTPAGAIVARRMASGSGMKQGQLYRTAIAMMGFSPAFLIGGIGAGMLGSAAGGWKLLVVQMLTQLTLTLMLRGAWKRRDLPVPSADRGEDEPPMRGAVLILLTICGYMALFGSLASVVRSFAGSGLADVLLCLLDVPTGALVVAGGDMGMEHRLILLAAMCGFGGMCVIMQTLGVLKDCGMDPWSFIGLRIVAAGLSAGYMALLLAAKADLPRWKAGLQAKPLEAAGLAASLMTLPVLLSFRKSVT